MEVFPINLWRNILSYLSLQELLDAARICKKMKEVIYKTEWDHELIVCGDDDIIHLVSTYQFRGFQIIPTVDHFENLHLLKNARVIRFTDSSFIWQWVFENENLHLMNEIAMELTECPELHITIGRSKLNDQVFERIGSAGKCQSIYMDDLVKDINLSNLICCSKIYLYNAQNISDQGIMQLARHRSPGGTIYLNIAVLLTDQSIEAFIQGGWDEIIIKNNEKITDSGISELIKLKNLQVLKINEALVTGSGFVEFRGLKLLDLTDCKYLETKYISEILVSGHHRSINLGNTNVTDECFQEQVNCGRIDLNECVITNRALMALSNCHTIELYGCKLITDEGLTILSKFNFYRLGLSRCDSLTDQGLMTFRSEESFPCLQELYLYNLAHVSDKMISILKDQMIHTKVYFHDN